MTHRHGVTLNSPPLARLKVTIEDGPNGDAPDKVLFQAAYDWSDEIYDVIGRSVSEHLGPGYRVEVSFRPGSLEVLATLWSAITIAINYDEARAAMERISADVRRGLKALFDGRWGNQLRASSYYEIFLPGAARGRGRKGFGPRVGHIPALVWLATANQVALVAVIVALLAHGW